MVQLTNLLWFAKIKKGKGMKKAFMDSLRLHVSGGSGGSGLPNYGGVGGQGGCVYCVGKANTTLQKITYAYQTRRIVAEHGESSRKKRILGLPGQDVMVEVPVGLMIYADEKKIGEINEEGETCILARGGPGGGPNNNYIGREGQKRTVALDLRLIADVGLVGFPNAGKSTLLKAISRARPKIASYPFTTIRPNLGIIEYPDLRQISLADLPGLIEGAHINIGMGHRFLRHLERTKLLLLVADVQGFSLSIKHQRRSCLETVLLLNKELELYNPDLLNKPSMLVINKMDTENSQTIFDEVKEKLKNLSEISEDLPADLRPKKCIRFEHIMGISAKENGDDITDLKNCIRDLLDQFDEVPSHENVIESIGEGMRERGPSLS